MYDFFINFVGGMIILPFLVLPWVVVIYFLRKILGKKK